MRQITVFDVNLVLQLVVFGLLLIGVYNVKGKKINLKKHRSFMGAVIVLNLVSIFLIMGRSFFANFGILVENSHSFGPAVTWFHATVGGLAEVLGISFLIRHPKKLRVSMRLTAGLWTLALMLGIVFYMYYYVLHA